MKKRDKWIEQRIEKELLAGEKMLWYAQPLPMRLAIMYPIRLVMGFVWFATFLTLMSSVFRVLAMRATITLPIVLAIFLGIGFFISEKPIMAFIQAGGTIYAATNRRIIIVKPRSVKSYSSQDIQFIERKDRGNNTGDIILGYENVLNENQKMKKERIGFFGVRHIEQVEAMLLENFRPENPVDNKKGNIFKRLMGNDNQDSSDLDLDDDENLQNSSKL